MSDAVQCFRISGSRSDGQLVGQAVHLVDETLQYVGDHQIVVADSIPHPLESFLGQSHSRPISEGRSAAWRFVAAERRARTSSPISIGLLT